MRLEHQSLSLIPRLPKEQCCAPTGVMRAKKSQYASYASFLPRSSSGIAVYAYQVASVSHFILPLP